MAIGPTPAGRSEAFVEGPSEAVKTPLFRDVQRLERSVRVLPLIAERKGRQHLPMLRELANFDPEEVKV
jgi:hypothetical protein